VCEVYQHRHCTPLYRCARLEEGEVTAIDYVRRRPHSMGVRRKRNKEWGIRLGKAHRAVPPTSSRCAPTRSPSFQRRFKKDADAAPEEGWWVRGIGVLAKCTAAQCIARWTECIEHSFLPNAGEAAC
jgi:hypothetical protein